MRLIQTSSLSALVVHSLAVITVAITLSFASASSARPAMHLNGSLWEEAAAHANVSATELYAIALQESAMRWRDGKVRPWPWTINSERGAMRFRSKREAQRALDELRVAGHCNIDVGLMQVNWCAHGKRFGHLDWFDPETNIRIASTILREARLSAADRGTGIGRYHSWTPHRASHYAHRVSLWTHRLNDAR